MLNSLSCRLFTWALASSDKLRDPLCPGLHGPALPRRNCRRSPAVAGSSQDLQSGEGLTGDPVLHLRSGLFSEAFAVRSVASSFTDLSTRKGPVARNEVVEPEDVKYLKDPEGPENGAYKNGFISGFKGDCSMVCSFMYGCLDAI